MSIIIVYESNAKRSSRNVVAVCSSKRAASTLIISRLLESKIINSSNIAKLRNELNETSQTQELDTNYIISETKVNTFIK